MNQLLNDHQGNHFYDLNGNLVESSTQKYTYDAWDRLLSVTEGNTQTTYQYDDQHRRLSKTSLAWDPITNTWNTKKSIFYLYLGQNEIGACDSEMNFTELRVLGHGRGAEIGAAVALELNGEVIIPFFDFAENTRVLLNASGQPLDTYRYTAFGEEILNGKALTAWRFSSKRTDEETGFVYFGRRYYNPRSGRWITADPLGYEAGPNLYAYVNNNPLTLIDLYGLEGRDWLEDRREQQMQERRDASGYERQEKSPVHDSSWNSARESVGGLASGYLDPLSSVSKFGGYAGQLAGAAWSGDYAEITEKIKSKSFSWFAGKAGEAVGLALNVVPAVRLIQAGIVAAKVGFFVAKETVKFTCKKVTQMATLKGATQATAKAAQVGKQLVAKEARVVAKKKINSFLFKKGGPLRDPVTQNYLPDPKALGRAHTN